jgi:hypothetical protein
MTTVYIAGAYRERERVLHSMRQVRESGRITFKGSTTYLTLIHDWVAHIDERKGDSPVLREAELSPEDRKDYALTDLRHACDADVFWLLAPEDGGRGCWFETGYIAFRRAQFGGPVMIASGPHVGDTIFTELLDYKFSQDAEAFDFLFQRGWKK